MDKKRIIIVGNSPTILSSKMGDVIDKFDTVVRFNNFVTSGYEESVGSKTDIWAIGTSSSILSRDPNDFREVWYKSSTPQTKLEAKFTGPIPKEKMVLLDDPPYSFDPDTGIAELSMDNPSTGFRAIMTALRNYEEVTVHGFSFFQETEGKFYKHYFGPGPQHAFYKHLIRTGTWRNKKVLDDVSEAIKKNAGVAFGKHHDGVAELNTVRQLSSLGKLRFLNEAHATKEFLEKYKEE